MRHRRAATSSPVAALFALLALVAVPVQAGMVLKMDLGDLTQRADRIFRGTVLSAEPGTLSAGGAELSTVTYRLRVDEAFKGDFPAKEGSTAVVELTMLGDLKIAPAADGIARLSALPQAPRLDVASDYLVFATAPSAIGLSAPVGLAQGSFKIYRDADKNEIAANGLDNLGLFAGPVGYATLARAIHDELGR